MVGKLAKVKLLDQAGIDYTDFCALRNQHFWGRVVKWMRAYVQLTKKAPDHYGQVLFC